MTTQVVLVAGGSKGVGLEAAVYLAQDKEKRYKVYATTRNLDSSLDYVKTKAEDTYDKTLFLRKLDVTQQESVDKIVQEIVEEEGKIDVLLYNAAVFDITWWETAPMKTFYDVMEVHYFGCVRLIKAIVPHMKAKRNGKILLMSAGLALTPYPIFHQLIASKFALEGFSEAIAPTLRKYNIWVSLIQPGAITTPMMQQIGGASKMFAMVAQKIPSEEDRQIVTQMLSNPNVAFGSQTTDDIAKLIEKVILSAKPDFRCQTSEVIEEMARSRFVDPTGNDAIDMWLK